MEYLTDFTMICLAVALILLGVAAGHRLGALVACWSAGGAWLALRFADRMWRPTFSEMQKADSGLDMEFWLPMSFGLLCAGFFAFVVLWIAMVKPRPQEVALPTRVGEILGTIAGGCVAVFLFLGAVQSQVMSASVERRMPQVLAMARPVLGLLGQEHLAPARRSGGAPGQGMAK